MTGGEILVRRCNEKRPIFRRHHQKKGNDAAKLLGVPFLNRAEGRPEIQNKRRNPVIPELSNDFRYLPAIGNEVVWRLCGNGRRRRLDCRPGDEAVRGS